MKIYAGEYNEGFSNNIVVYINNEEIKLVNMIDTITGEYMVFNKDLLCYETKKLRKYDFLELRMKRQF